MPRNLGSELIGHSVITVQKAGWSGVLNGRLMALIHGNFDAFVTVDKNLPNEQKVSALSFGVLVLRVASNDIDDLRPLVPDILLALQTLGPGRVATVSAHGF